MKAANAVIKKFREDVSILINGFLRAAGDLMKKSAKYSEH
jgi:hypothetical protein